MGNPVSIYNIVMIMLDICYFMTRQHVLKELENAYKTHSDFIYSWHMHANMQTVVHKGICKWVMSYYAIPD